MTNYFGENIRSLRKERGYTQETLADFLGVSFQAVSKWERGETYPDVATLPSIASFFGVTTDFLLGIDRIEKEEKIQEFILYYQQEWKTGNFENICEKLKEGIRTYPGDWRLIVRYFNALVSGAVKKGDKAASVKNEAEALYNNIKDFCSVDSIRIWADKIYVTYLKALSNTEEAEEIIEKMPLMQNGRDYFAASFYPAGDRSLFACQNALCELAYMTSEVCTRLCSNDIPLEEKIRVTKAVLDFVEELYGDNLGKLYINVIWSRAMLGKWYLEAGDSANATLSFKESFKIAKRFDSIPDGESLAGEGEISKLVTICKYRIPKYRGRCEAEQIAAFVAALDESIELE